jgi:hypothetical protein
MRLLLASLAVLCLLALPLAADQGLSKLRIEVKTLGGKPVDRASVVVQFGGRSIKKLGRKAITHWETRTNQEGVARIPEIPQGKVRVQVIAKGYQTYGETFEVSQDEQTLEVKLKPPQPQYSSHE